MFGKSTLVSLAGLGLAAASTARTSAPSGCLSVPDDYSTIQKAVDAASSGGCIYIAAGTYKEQVSIESPTDLTIYGETEDTSTYSGNKVTITSGLSQENGLSDDGTATVQAHAQGLSMYNINIVNSFGKGSQAIALSATKSEQGYYGMQLTGYQDTLLAESGTQVYANSYIEGAIDYIFGQEGVAWFQNCDLYSTYTGGSITASGRSSSSSDSYYVFDKCSIDGSSGSGTIYLGRPWQAYARVMFQECTMSDVVNSAGWTEWQTSDTRTSNVAFDEYDNTGAGASGTRASFATKASAAVSISTILGSDYSEWVDSSYV